MENKKPLVIVSPMSESLKKLKEIFEEDADNNGVEIFEVDSVAEVAQLLPTLNQSLTLVSDIKKCAKFLQAIKKYIFKSNSKVILITPKQIPRRTLDKFSKVGLTEYIKEPVPPKTLVYKINLLLRSIKTVQEEEEEAGIKHLEGMNKKEQGSIKDRTGGPDEEEQEGESLYAREKKKAQFIQEEAVEKEAKQEHEAEVIDMQMRGKVSQVEESKEEESRERKNQAADHIDGHYRGETGQAEEVDDGPMKGQGQAQKPEDEEVDMRALREEINHEIEEESDDLLKKEKEIEEESSKSPHEGEVDHIDGKLRGKITEQEKRDDSPMMGEGKADHIEDELDKSDFHDKKEIVDDEIHHQDLGTKLDLENEEPEDYLDGRNKEVDELEEKDSSHLDLIDDSEQEERQKNKADEIDGNMVDEKQRKADHIETHYKGKSSLQKEEDTHDKEKDFLDKAQEEEEGHHTTDLNLKKEVEEDEENAPKVQLDLEDEKQKSDQEERQQVEDEDSLAPKVNLDLIDDSGTPQDDLEKNEKALEDEEDSKNKTNLDLLDDDDHLGKKNSLNHDGGDFSRTKKLGDKDEEKKKNGLYTSQGGTDKIQTHYSNKGIKHQDQEWTGLEKNKMSEDIPEFEKAKNQGEISMAMPQDLGEQTIDYDQLKKEFEGISLDSLGKKKKQGYSFESGEARQVSPGKKTTFSNDPLPDAVDSHEGEPEDEEKESNQVYEPMPNGLDVAIKVYQMYLNTKLKEDEIYRFLAKEILNYRGYANFFMYDSKKKVFIEKFSGVKNLKTDQDPEERIKDWENTVHQHSSRWSEMTLPTWSDKTFQEKDMEFFYPYFEGVNNMGYAIVQFNDGMQECKTSTIEVILETARGLYLENYHEGKKADYGSKAEKTSKKPGGFLSKFFKKAS